MGEPVVTPLPPLEVTQEQEDFFQELLGDERLISPITDKYKVKHAYLQEKFEHIEAENLRLRRRLQKMKKEVLRAMQVKRTLCNMLDERGDQWYKAKLEVKDEEPTVSLFEYNPMKDMTPMRYEPLDGTPKRKPRPSGNRSRAKVCQTKPKPKELQMTAEQREEEERARAKIVSIIDSVFSETAKKNAKIEEEMKSKLASVARDPSGRFISSRVNAVVPPPEKKEEPEKKKKKEEPPFINYRMFNENDETAPSAKRHRMENGVIAGISFTYTPNEEELLPMSTPGPSSASSQHCQ